MRRRGFLGAVGAIGVAAFVPFVIPESKKTVAPPRITEGLVPFHTSHKYIFVSKYTNLRVQVTRGRAIQFHGGVYRTDSAADAAALMKARRQDEHTLAYDIVLFGKDRIPADWFKRGELWA